MDHSFLRKLQEAKVNDKKLLAILIDPDKIDKIHVVSKFAQEKNVAAILVGGSLVTTGNVDETILKIKSHYRGPILVFPGDFSQASAHADALLFLSLISGRNADLLIGKHVSFASKLKSMNLEIISCGYILVNSGTPTSVEYMSNTVPIPHDKPEIAVSTAMAGEMLGLKCIYMESGSGAEHEVSIQMIKQVADKIEIPLIIGGGIKTKDQIENAWNAGATMVVVGTVIEQDPVWLTDL